ncbi:MBL fold metallo-hydrolase [Pontibacter diazotrophicus]|uniref:MBL fold metallo-hydrolase n=1 Tax=Pontibacter diazotrophicus TaxID=1400979 RepID=A0A3D8LHL0_9BACT|nr:MBL fold metallo-hydrolase [Pontibacter diazotrophicus]RDV16885.1 MBL fold metallo-hydrolase [Pontibacter diazotrophicus]
MKKSIRVSLYVLGFILLLAIVAGCSLQRLSPQFGAEAKGDRLETIKRSPNYFEGEFHNPVETNMDIGFKGYMKLLSSRLFGESDEQQPDYDLPVQKIDTSRFDVVQDTATVITWLGHSAFLVEIDGKRLLLDPMMGDRASPFSFIGPKRFSELPVSIEALPRIDAVLISHDHYDHLDYSSIQKLSEKTGHFFVALGVGAHLERWGVPAAKITEMDWWQETSYQGLTFASTPSRHFSGRGLSDRMKTLWTSWVILGNDDRIFFSGDSGYFNGFEQIGMKYGPFDITLMECGQYNELWPNIHMMPEQTVQAHIDLRGKLLMPIHWGAFTLAMHSWTDPIERATNKAAELRVPVTTPRIGEPVILQSKVPQQDWWRE